MHWIASLLVTTAKEAVVFSAIAALVSVFPLLLIETPFVSAYGFVLLLEATGLMIVGGALDISTTGSARFTLRQVRMLFGGTAPKEEIEPVGDRKRAQFTAAKYSLTGVLLFVEALALAFALY